MADDEFSTNDVVLELQQARRTFQIFEHAEKVVRYLLTVEQRQKDAEAFLATVQEQADAAKAKLDERIKTGELRAEAAEQRAATIDKQIADAQAASEQQIAAAKAQLVKDVEAAQQALREAKAELAAIKKQIADAKKTAEGAR